MPAAKRADQPTAATPAEPLTEEQTRLAWVLDKTEVLLDKLSATPRYFSDDDPDAKEPQTADEIAQQTVERLLDDQADGLRRALKDPYFGRIDFQERPAAVAKHRAHPPRDRGVQGADAHPAALYIGKRGIEDRDSGDRLVIDWRAPIASLFYSFGGQEDTASYESPDGRIDGTVFLKRNLAIRDGKLQRVVDAFVRGQDNLSVTDEFLLYRLAEGKDNRLRDIVSTIQSEQNKIIRADRNQAVFIQGVAGSGKTTVALHRVAYLLYQYADRMRAERMVIFAPNAMFVEYISEVLPELGVGGIQQTTFADWALRQLDHAVLLRDTGQRLARWFAIGHDAALDAEFVTARRKGSVQFAEELARFVIDLEATLLPDIDFSPWDGAVLGADEIGGWFRSEYAQYPLAKRLERVLARVKRWYETEYKRAQLSDPKGSVRKQAAARFRSFCKRWPELSAVRIYQQFGELRGKSIAGRPLAEPEDLAPLLWLHMQLHGLPQEMRFDHVVIDEAQDFSPLQIEVLKTCCPAVSFTILGDLAQSIHSNQGITNWDDFLRLFPVDARSFHALDVSYRSTTEIIDFANHILALFPGFRQAQPVFRSGHPVVVSHVELTTRHRAAAAWVTQLLQESPDISTVAVLCRTEQDCQAYVQTLQDSGTDAHAISALQQHYQGGVSVLPVYLAKGLEFDAVLVVDAEATNYPVDARSARLLYVACTRALHRLAVHYTDRATALVER